jgi:hypothetical protein
MSADAGVSLAADSRSDCSARPDSAARAWTYREGGERPDGLPATAEAPDLVAVCAAVEGFFQFGQRWRSYRGTLERLKTEGWLFLEQAGPYAASSSHSEAYAAFAARVEELIKTDVDVYLTEVAVEKQPQKEAGKEA